eukprot:3703166-Rhodomonas_salina.3
MKALLIDVGAPGGRLLRQAGRVSKRVAIGVRVAAHPFEKPAEDPARLPFVLPGAARGSGQGVAVAETGGAVHSVRVRGRSLLRGRMMFELEREDEEDKER